MRRSLTSRLLRFAFALWAYATIVATVVLVACLFIAIDLYLSPQSLLKMFALICGILSRLSYRHKDRSPHRLLATK